MAMNENKKNESTTPAGTPKNSGRYPWVQDEGLTEIEAMGNALLELEDELNSVVEDLHRWFGRHGIEELGTMRGDLDHINEVLRPRIECQHSSIKAQYNKKLKQLDELARAYAGLIEKNVILEDEADELKKQIADFKDQIDRLQKRIRERDKALERADKLLVENSKLYASKSDLERELRVKISENEQLSEKLNDCEERICELETKASDQGKIYSQLLNQNKYLKAEAADNAFQANQLREENERLTAKVKEAEDKNLKLVLKKYELETRVHQLESESGDSYDYEEGYDDGMNAMYDDLLTMMGIINVDDFEEVFHISETATDKEIIEHFRQMHPHVFMEACERYKAHVIDTIKVGDEVQYVSGWRMIVTEVKDKWYKGIIRLSQSPMNIRKDQCRKTGNHYSSIPFSYDGRLALDEDQES